MQFFSLVKWFASILKSFVEEVKPNGKGVRRFVLVVKWFLQKAYAEKVVFIDVFECCLLFDTKQDLVGK